MWILSWKLKCEIYYERRGSEYKGTGLKHENLYVPRHKEVFLKELTLKTDKKYE